MYSVESSASDHVGGFKIGKMKNMFASSLNSSELAGKPLPVNNYNKMSNTDNGQVELDVELVDNTVLESNCVLLEAEEQPTDYNNDVSKYFENDEDERGNDEEEDEERNSANVMIDSCLGKVHSPRRFVNNAKLPMISNLNNNNNNSNNVDDVADVCASADWDKVYSKRLSNAHRVSLVSREETNDAETEAGNGDGGRKSRQVYTERRNSICSLDAEHGKEQCAIANFHTENHMVGNSWEVQVFDSFSADALHGNLADKYSNNYNNKNHSNKTDNANDMIVNTDDNYITGNKNKCMTKPRTSNFTQSMVDVSTPQVSVQSVKQECNKLIKTVQGAITQLNSKRLTQTQLVKLNKLAVQYRAEIENCLLEYRQELM